MLLLVASLKRQTAELRPAEKEAACGRQQGERKKFFATTTISAPGKSNVVPRLPGEDDRPTVLSALAQHRYPSGDRRLDDVAPVAFRRRPNPWESVVVVKLALGGQHRCCVLVPADLTRLKVAPVKIVAVKR